MVLDAIGVFASGALAFLMRFELSFNDIPAAYGDAFFRLLPLEILVTWVVFFACRMYHYVWHNVSTREVAAWYCLLC